MDSSFRSRWEFIRESEKGDRAEEEKEKKRDIPLWQFKPLIREVHPIVDKVI